MLINRLHASAVALLITTFVSAAQAGTDSSTTSTGAVSAEEMKLLEAAFGQPEADEDEMPQAILIPTTDSAPGTGNALRSVFQTLNPDMSFILDVAAAYYTTDQPLQTGAHDPIRTGFTFQQLELSVNASVDPFFRFDANIVFAEFGVEVEEAYATSLAFPWSLQLRGGQFLHRFGRINSTHPHTWHFVDQPLAIGKFFGPEGSRGLGAELSWLTPLPWYVELVASANNPYLECCARSFLGSSNAPIRNVSDLLYTTAIKQFFPFDDDWSLSWGLSAQFGPNPTGNQNRTEIYGTDVYLRFRPTTSAVRAALSWQTEAIYRSRQVPSDRLEDVGVYSQLVWNIDLRWETGVRYEFVSGVENDYLDPDWNRNRHRLAGQFTFYPSHFARIRAQVNYDDPMYRPDDYWGFILNLEVLVGAHGAHNF